MEAKKTKVMRGKKPTEIIILIILNLSFTVLKESLGACSARRPEMV